VEVREVEEVSDQEAIDLDKMKDLQLMLYLMALSFINHKATLLLNALI
jgi:hypothetical protein